MGAATWPFLEGLFPKALKFVQKSFSVSTKDAAIGALPWLLSAAAKFCVAKQNQMRDWIVQNLELTLKTLSLTLREEEDPEFEALMLQTMHECIEEVGNALGQNFMSNQRFKKNMKLAEYQVSQYLQSREERERIAREDEDYEELELVYDEETSRNRIIVKKKE